MTSRPATMRDVAARAGVGLKTASRVLNGEPYVSTALTERVRSAAAELHYELNVYAGGLKRTGARTRTVGLTLASVDNPFAAAVHRGVEDTMAAHGIAVFAASTGDDAERERRVVTEFLRRRVDGLVLTAASGPERSLPVETGTPLVYVDRRPPGPGGADAHVTADVVVSANHGGARTATAHLLAHGHRRIAFIGDDVRIATAAERRDGFLDALADAGRTPAACITGVRDEHAAHAAVLALLDGDEPPTAIFAAQNLLLLGTVRALRDRSAQHTVAHVGFDDVPLADLLDPPVTVVAQDPVALGRLSAERLFARMSGDDAVSQTLTVPTALIVRGSGEIEGTP